MSRKIIINADDFGLCEGVNKAVAKAHTDGVLTSATIMANATGAEKAVEIAKSLPGLGIGAHLNLTEGCPLAKDNRVNPISGSDGKFAFSPSKLCILSVLSPKIRDAIRLELETQIQWLIDRGLHLTHLDSHKHVHSFPVIFKIVTGLAQKYNISAIRWPIERQKFPNGRWPQPDRKGVIRSKIIHSLAGINQFQSSKYFKTSEFLGIAHTGRIDVSFFKAVSLHNSAPVSEIMTHPGFMEGLDSVNTRLTKQRQVELNALCSEQTKLFFEKAGIQLVHYGQL